MPVAQVSRVRRSCSPDNELPVAVSHDARWRRALTSGFPGSLRHSGGTACRGEAGPSRSTADIATVDPDTSDVVALLLLEQTI